MTPEPKMKVVAILRSATSLSEQRTYELADEILAAIPSSFPAADEDARDANKEKRKANNAAEYS